MYGYHSHEDNKSVQNLKEGLVRPLRLHRASPDKFIGPQPEILPNTAFDMAQDLFMLSVKESYNFQHKRKVRCSSTSLQ